MSLLRTLKRTYHLPGVDPRPLHDAAKRLLYRRVPAFPRTVQVQTRTGCQAACVFCPYHDSKDKVPRGVMSDDLFHKLIGEIARHGVRRISPYLMNEPFLDKSLLEKARYIKAQIPKSKLTITTNAGVLRPEIVDDLVADNPLRYVYISFQGMEKGPYEETMRGAMVFERTKENVEYLVTQRDKHAPELKIVVTMVKTSKIDAEKAVAYWRSRGVAAQYTALENRGGNIAGFSALNAGEGRIFRDCNRLFKHAYILFNGDLVLCCTDYYKSIVLGNAGQNTIEDVWNGPRAQKIRHDFLRGDLSQNPLCANCEIADLKGAPPPAD